MQTEITHSERHFQQLLEAAPDAILEVDQLGKITIGNAAAEKMFGYSRRELIGMSVDALAPDAMRAGHTRKRDSYTRHPQVRPMGIGMELRAQRKDGTLFPVEISLSPNQSGEEMRVIAIVRDISERKKIEETLRRTEERLREADKLEALARLAGGTAHEFNNLLTTVLGYAELLQTALNGDIPKSAYLEKIRAAGRRAASLTRQLLAFGRRQVLAPKLLDLNLVLESAGRRIAQLAGEKVETVMTPAPEPVWILADPHQIDGMITDLATHALEAIPGGGKLVLGISTIELQGADCARHSRLAPGRYAVISIHDNGPGLTPETQARLFEPFFTSWQSGKLSGLGLATVYGIASQCGGTASVDSEADAGTTLRVYLPLQSPPQLEAVTAPVSSLKMKGRGETILLVEDQLQVLELSREFLEQSGYHVLPAASGDAALKIAGQFAGKIQLLLTDVVMPGMNGRKLAKELKTLRPDIKVLYVSGFPDEAFEESGSMDAGDVFLGKPFELETLAQKVQLLLDKSYSA